eukprot:Awhi_evm1s7014
MKISKRLTSLKCGYRLSEKIDFQKFLKTEKQLLACSPASLAVSKNDLKSDGDSDIFNLDDDEVEDVAIVFDRSTDSVLCRTFGDELGKKEKSISEKDAHLKTPHFKPKKRSSSTPVTPVTIPVTLVVPSDATDPHITLSPTPSTSTSASHPSTSGTSTCACVSSTSSSTTSASDPSTSRTSATAHNSPTYSSKSTSASNQTAHTALSSTSSLSSSLCHSSCTSTSSANELTPVPSPSSSPVTVKNAVCKTQNTTTNFDSDNIDDLTLSFSSVKDETCKEFNSNSTLTHSQHLHYQQRRKKLRKSSAPIVSKTDSFLDDEKCSHNHSTGNFFTKRRRSSFINLTYGHKHMNESENERIDQSNNIDMTNESSVGGGNDSSLFRVPPSFTFLSSSLNFSIKEKIDKQHSTLKSAESTCRIHHETLLNKALSGSRTSSIAVEFLTYLEKHCSHENLLFYWAVQDYKEFCSNTKLPILNVLEKARKLFLSFLTPKAELEVNVPATMREAAEDKILSGLVDINLFDDTQQHTYVLLKFDCFQRFYETKEMECYTKRRKKKVPSNRSSGIFLASSSLGNTFSTSSNDNVF